MECNPTGDNLQFFFHFRKLDDYARISEFFQAPEVVLCVNWQRAIQNPAPFVITAAAIPGDSRAVITMRTAIPIQLRSVREALLKASKQTRTVQTTRWRLGDSNTVLIYCLM